MALVRGSITCWEKEDSTQQPENYVPQQLLQC